MNPSQSTDDFEDFEGFEEALQNQEEIAAMAGINLQTFRPTQRTGGSQPSRYSTGGSTTYQQTAQPSQPSQSQFVNPWLLHRQMPGPSNLTRTAPARNTQGAFSTAYPFQRGYHVGQHQFGTSGPAQFVANRTQNQAPRSSPNNPVAFAQSGYDSRNGGQFPMQQQQSGQDRQFGGSQGRRSRYHDPSLPTQSNMLYLSMQNRGHGRFQVPTSDSFAQGSQATVDETIEQNQAQSSLAQPSILSTSTRRNMASERAARTRAFPDLPNSIPDIPVWPQQYANVHLGEGGQVGFNSGRNLMARFGGSPTARLRYNISIERGRDKKVDESTSNVYPPSTTRIPGGTSLSDICQFYPLHVWGSGLRLFLAERIKPKEIWSLLPEDCRRDGSKERPHNYIQQAIGREADRMSAEEGHPRKAPTKRPTQRQGLAKRKRDNDDESAAPDDDSHVDKRPRRHPNLAPRPPNAVRSAQEVPQAQSASQAQSEPQHIGVHNAAHLDEHRQARLQRYDQMIWELEWHLTQAQVRLSTRNLDPRYVGLGGQEQWNLAAEDNRRRAARYRRERYRLRTANVNDGVQFYREVVQAGSLPLETDLDLDARRYLRQEHRSLLRHYVGQLPALQGQPSAPVDNAQQPSDGPFPTPTQGGGQASSSCTRAHGSNIAPPSSGTGPSATERDDGPAPSAPTAEDQDASYWAAIRTQLRRTQEESGQEVTADLMSKEDLDRWAREQRHRRRK